MLKDGRWELEDAWVSAVGQEPELYKHYLLSTYLTPTQVRDSLGTVFSISFWDLPELHRDRGAGGTSRHAISRAVSAAAVAAVPARDHGADRGHLLAQGVPLRQRADQRHWSGLPQDLPSSCLAEVSRNFAMAGLTSAMAAAWVPVIIAASPRAHRALVQRGRVMLRARRIRSCASRRAQPGLAASKGHAPCAPALWSLFACVFACFLALPSPWQPAFGQSADRRSAASCKPPKIDSSEPMLLQADEMVYDNENNRITAKGNVEIYYGNYTLLADQRGLRPQRQHARGGGQCPHQGSRRRDDHLRPHHADRRFPRRVHRRLACGHQGRHAHRRASPPRARPATSRCSRRAGSRLAKSARPIRAKPPTWRIRANEIIHRKDRRRSPIKNAFFDFFGVPVHLGPLLPEAPTRR